MAPLGSEENGLKQKSEACPVNENAQDPPWIRAPLWRRARQGSDIARDARRAIGDLRFQGLLPDHHLLKNGAVDRECQISTRRKKTLDIGQGCIGQFGNEPRIMIRRSSSSFSGLQMPPQQFA